jgi:hypothetical protein
MSDFRIDDPALGTDLLGGTAPGTNVFCIGDRHQFVLIVEKKNFGLADMRGPKKARQHHLEKVV